MHNKDSYITNHVEEIRKNAKFLEDKGYSFKLNNKYIIEYSSNTYIHQFECYIFIIVYYKRYDNFPGVDIRFRINNSIPEQYDLELFRNMKRYEAGERDIFQKAREELAKGKIFCILSLLEYLKNNFEDITNIDFCRKTEKKINENFDNGVWIQIKKNQQNIL